MTMTATKIREAAKIMGTLERLVAAVKDRDAHDSKFAKALATLKTLSRKEDIPIAIIGGLAAIHFGYERFTKDIDIVVRHGDTATLRVESFTPLSAAEQAAIGEEGARLLRFAAADAATHDVQVMGSGC